MHYSEFYKQYKELYRDREDFNSHNGINVTMIREGYCECEAELKQCSMNIQGGVHGGLIFTLCDVATGVAAFTYGQRVLTLDSSISFLRPGRGKKIRAVGECLKNGKTVCFCEARVYDDEDRLIATGSVNMFKTDVTLERMFEAVTPPEQK